MQSDAYYSMGIGGIDYFETPTLDHLFSQEQDDELLLDLNDFLYDPTPLLLDSSINLHNTPNYLEFYPPQLHFDSYNYYPLHQLEPPTDYYLLDLESYQQPPPKRQKCCFQPNFSPPESGGAPAAGATRQSIAARDRRKRISDKTNELAKLLPGASSSSSSGKNMNTAEMLLNAFKYVKFMQSQLSLLQLIADREIKNESLRIVGSSAVQERLYMKDKCLVSLELVEQLANDGDLKKLIQSASSVHNG